MCEIETAENIFRLSTRIRIGLRAGQLLRGDSRQQAKQVKRDTCVHAALGSMRYYSPLPKKDRSAPQMLVPYEYNEPGRCLVPPIIYDKFPNGCFVA
jgi:hypothetical protein